MWNFFGWVRERTRDAVLGGFQDAMTTVDPDTPAPDLNALRDRVAATMLPVHEEPPADTNGRAAKRVTGRK